MKSGAPNSHIDKQYTKLSEHLQAPIETVTVHALRKQQRILPMLRIPDRQNLLPELYRTGFSVQKIPTMYSNFISAG